MYALYGSDVRVYHQLYRYLKLLPKLLPGPISVQVFAVIVYRLLQYVSIGYNLMEFPPFMISTNVERIPKPSVIMFCLSAFENLYVRTDNPKFVY